MIGKRLAVFGGVAVVASVAVASMDKSMSEEAINARIVPVAKVKLAAAQAAGGGAPRTGEAIYKGACAACHDTGAAGAPKLGDNGAWAPRLKLGYDGLLKSAIAGKNAMPPRGGSDASDLELGRAIVYLTNKSGGNLPEPK